MPKILQYNDNLASLSAVNVLGESRKMALEDLTQKQMEKLTGAVAQEEEQVQAQLTDAFLQKDSNIKDAVKEYTEELSELYYESSSADISPFSKTNVITKKYLPTLNIIVDAINNDPIFETNDLTATRNALLKYAKKIRTQLESRLTLGGKLKGSVSKLMGSNVVMGALAGAATKNPFIALGMFAYQQSRKKNDYADKFSVKRKQLSLAANQAKRKTPQDDITTTNPTPEAAPAAGADTVTPPASDISASATSSGDTASPFKGPLDGNGQYAVSPDAASGVGGAGSQEIVKILNQHTGLLGKIYGVNAKSLKIQEDQIAKQAAAAEETNLETQGATASKATGEPVGKEDEKEGGLLSSIMNLASGFMGGRLGGIAKLFAVGGTAGLVSRLGKGALAKVGASRIGQTATSLGSRAMAMGSGALSKTAATATKLGGGAVSVATKAAGAGKGALTAFIKKIVPQQVGKLAAKSVPFLGAGLAAGFAAWKLLKGDVKGAGLEAAAAIPGAGILAAVASMARDIYHDYYGVQPEDDPEAGTRFTEVKDEVQNTANETLENLGLKGKKENDQKEQTAEKQDAANQQKADQADQQKSSETKSASPTTTGTDTSPTAAPAPTTNAKPSFLNRLVKGAARVSLAVATGGLSEAFRMFNTDTATPDGGGRSGGAGASGSWNGDLTQVLEFGGESGQLQNFKGLHPVIQNKVIQAAQEYFQKTGKKLKVNSAKRDSAKQQQLWDESVKAGRPGRGPNGMAIAKPGRSRHERGLAIDIQNYRDPIAVAALNKQGLFQGVPGDPVHFQLDGNPSLDQLATANDAQSSSMGAPATAPNTSSPVGAAPSGNLPGSPSTTGTAASMGDTASQGRAAITSNLTGPSAPNGNAGGGGVVNNIVQGGNTTVGGGNGGGSAAQIIPAPIDREPTIRRILDGSLS
jgi:LAS superfamily LD-carboxypeptidase LdcB